MPLAKSGALSPDEFSQIGREGKDGEHAEQGVQEKDLESVH